MASFETYQSPLASRYASEEILKLFSAKFKYTTWRKLWYSLAKAQKTLGISISEEQVRDLKEHINSVDFDTARSFEKEVKHEVMAHILAFGNQAKIARPIIHLGATSSFVMDNTDLVQYREALKLLHQRIIHVIEVLSNFAKTHADVGTIGYTHFQSAQPTTVGKRACLWLQDLLEDEKNLESAILELPFLGVKGATGTCASFLKLFKGDFEKVDQLEKLVAHDFGFDSIVPIASQTYPRKLDVKIMQTLSGIASTAHKFATDIRLLSHTQELSEGFGNTQVGSSAMPYKKNPIFSERLCGLSRLVISLCDNASYTHALQWLERSLDDSSNRRVSIPEAFIATESLLRLFDHILSHLQVNKKRIAKLLKEHSFFHIQEDLLMVAVEKGGDRQKVHGLLKNLSLKVSENIQNDTSFDFTKEILENPDFFISKEELNSILNENTRFGASKIQCLSFLDQAVSPLFKKLKKGFSKSLNF